MRDMRGDERTGDEGEPGGVTGTWPPHRPGRSIIYEIDAQQFVRPPVDHVPPAAVVVVVLAVPVDHVLHAHAGGLPPARPLRQLSAAAVVRQ